MDDDPTDINNPEKLITKARLLMVEPHSHFDPNNDDPIVNTFSPMRSTSISPKSVQDPEWFELPTGAWKYSALGVSVDAW